jgi:phosphoribosylglycinamide formyltransferase 1
MPRIVIFTKSELRHVFFRKALALAEGIEVLASFCEGSAGSLKEQLDQEDGRLASNQLDHLMARDLSEKDFFGPLVALSPDLSRPIQIAGGGVNDPIVWQAVRDLAPDLLICYGASIIKEPLLSFKEGGFLNVHLGLSPYYRGSGTNFWPLVNCEPEFVGATFMYLNSGIDTGEIIHQIRASVYPGDSPHQIGNRLITDMVKVYTEIILNFENLATMPQPALPDNARLYARKDFSAQAVAKMYNNFAEGMIETYLVDMKKRAERVPLVLNQALTCEA